MSILNKVRGGAFAVALAAATALSASGASAATVLSNGGTIPLVGNSGTFTSVHDSADAGFSDVFSFVVGGLSNASASVTATFVKGGKDITFSSILLDGSAFTPVLTGVGTTEFWSLDNVVIGGGAHTITLNGSTNATATQHASYSGTLDIAAVPEPATWGMLLVGFGLVGAGMRSRKRTVVLA